MVKCAVNCIASVSESIYSVWRECLQYMYKQVHAGTCKCILYFSMYKFPHCKTSIFKVSALCLFSGLSPLHLAVLHGHKDLAKMVLDAGGDINAMVSPCAVLTQHWHHNITNSKFTISAFFKIFFLCCFYLNKDIKSGQSPLMYAVESNNADMVHFLIEVMRICGQGEKCCYSVQLIVFGFLFPAHKLNN